MKIAVIVVIVICVGAPSSSSAMAHPLRQSLLGLGRASNENDNQSTEESANSAVTKIQQLGRPGSPGSNAGHGWKGIPRDKRQFSDPSYWNSFRAPDRHFDPIHLQNWGSQFGRSYRKFDGLQSGRRLRPVSGIYESGDPTLNGVDSLQNWRALYSEDHF